MRLNKRLVELGYCSRRKADEYIEKGLVKVNGHVASLGEQVDEKSEIEVNGEIVPFDEEKIILAYNKERGVVCTESNVEKSDKISDKIKEFGFGKRLFTIGRLDKDSTGLIIITNDGDLAKELTDTKNRINDKASIKVLVMGVIIALIIIPTLLFLIYLYERAPNKPASPPLTKQVDTVIIGRVANMVAPLGSKPKITIISTIIPNTKPISIPTYGPYTAPAITIGINVSVIEKPPKLIYVDNICKTIIIAANIVNIANLLFFIN